VGNADEQDSRNTPLSERCANLVRAEPAEIVAAEIRNTL